MINNKINTKGQGGFTIVELLIVIVVIGILAAITIVAYSGITARANNTKAISNADSVQKVAETYNADLGHYPGLTTDFTTGSTSAKLPASLTVSRLAPTPGNGLTTVQWEYVGVAGATTGGRITYWDFTTGAVSTAVTSVYVGSATSGSTFVVPAS